MSKDVSSVPPEIIAVGNREWHMWAVQRSDGEFYEPGDRRHSIQFLNGNATLVPVTVTLDQNGDYWGWISARETTPRLIYPSRKLLQVCFPHPLEDFELAGHGAVVRMHINIR